MVNDTITSQQFEALYRRYHAALCEVACDIVGTRAVAEDVVQDVFFAFWMQRDQTRVRVSMAAYLFGAVRNRAISALRRQATSRRTLRSAGDDAPPGMSEPTTAIDVQWDRNEQIEALHRAVGRLPDRSRLALRLRWAHKLSYAETADAMAIPVKGVEKLLSIAMRLLRADLVGEHPSYDDNDLS